jgi:hypothetical protein
MRNIGNIGNIFGYMRNIGNLRSGALVDIVWQ